MKVKPRQLLSLAGALLAFGVLVWHYYFREDNPIPPLFHGGSHVEVEQKLTALATKKIPPQEGDWLHTYREAGQPFQEYVASDPVRRCDELQTIYLCLVGKFSSAQERILEITQEYLSLYFNSQVRIHNRVSLDSVPASAQRRHPAGGQLQFLTQYFLDESMKSDCPADALAYVAFSSVDLWTKDVDGRDWNYVFGQASLRNRLGVWSLARFGNPEDSLQAYAECLKLTMGTASHEIGHILGMRHCVYYECNMNGSNHLNEARRAPLPLCPICLRKICWNMKVEPRSYLQKLLEFSKKYDIQRDTTWYQSAIEALGQ